MSKLKRRNKVVSKKKYWFYLHPYTLLSIVGGEMLLYNTLNGDYILEKDNKLIKKFNELEEGYVISLENDESDDKMRNFLKKIKGKYLGDYYEKSLSEKKPVQFPPFPILDLEYKANIPDNKFPVLLEDDNIANYLQVLTIQITNECGMVCKLCKDGYRQFTHCFKDTESSHIKLGEFKTLLKEINRYFSIQQINLIGGNLFKHPNIQLFISELNDYDYKINYFINYENFNSSVEYSDILSMIKKNNEIFLSVTLPLNISLFKECMERTKKFKSKVNYFFIIERESQFNELEDIINEYEIKNFSVHPYYDGENIDFFKKNVFIKKEYIESSIFKMGEIKTKMLINPQKIKQISISCSGDVFSSFNHPKLGKINKDKFVDMVRSAFASKESSWRQTRENFKQCWDCTMQFLCPPISDYEHNIETAPMCWKSEGSVK